MFSRELPLTESESRVLMALLRTKEIPIMSLPKAAGLGNGAVYNSVRSLTERGLVSEEREANLPRRRFMKLTEEGRKIAALLERVEHELGETK
jgi:DNA-binding MarR family transcriptional regulator